MTIVTVQDAIEAFLQQRRRYVSPQTCQVYRRTLQDWQAWRLVQGLSPEVQAISVQELRDYLDYLAYDRVAFRNNHYRPPGQTGLAPATVRSVWRTLKSLWNFLFLEEVLTREQEAYFRKKRIPAPRVPTQARPTYDPETIEQLLHAAAEDPDPEQSWRDRAIILLLLQSGMRAGELCGLRDEDVDLEERTAVVRGKGNQMGVIFWSDRADSAIRAYLRVRSGTFGGPFFRSLNAPNIGGPLRPTSIRSLFRRLATLAGVDLPKTAPVHALRHTFAHNALDAGADISQVSQLLRHQRLETTMIYIRERNSRLKAVHASLFKPKR